MPDTNMKEGIIFRKHPLGFIVIEKKNEEFGDDDTIFFHGHELISSRTIEALAGKIRTKKIQGLRRSANIGRAILHNLDLTSAKLIVNSRFEECYFKLDNSYFLITQTGKKATLESHFNSFVTNGCLFGTHLQGILQNGAKIPLIDHQLKLTSPVIDIEVDDQLHLYEKSTFKTLTEHLVLMKKIGANNFRIIYHLPGLDYILSGVLRFLRGEMTYFALKKYVVHIKLRCEIHKMKIREITRDHQVNVFFLSPFDNLLDPTIQMNANSVLSVLYVDTKKFSDPDVVEMMYVKKILRLLKKNNYSPKIKKIWKKLGHINSNFQPVDSLKDVLRMGNSSVIAYGASRGPTCVWLSADEHPVFNHYKSRMSATFGEVICFSFLPSMLNYVEMKADGKGQQTLFRYRTDIYQNLIEDKIRNTISGSLLKFGTDNHYLKIIDWRLFLLLDTLWKFKLIFNKNIPLEDFFKELKLSGSALCSKADIKKNMVILVSKLCSKNGYLNSQLFFANRDKIKGYDINHKEKNLVRYLAL